ncbi:methyl-accepting chemotaxis protein [Chitinilyticum litopenaei]|uniref:methyl-accepting chemotaxis protein n=1 Tax=Chitinilyticum litopenaei TaxID=1121276 RepID=UPI000420CDD8|nr:methyl-accepting chemotaxis protein [Chitinilyticum litopenaei]
MSASIMSIQQRVGLLRGAADQVLIIALWILLLLSTGLAGWYGSWLELVLVGLPAALVPTLLQRMSPPGALTTRLAVAVSLMMFAALMIHQARGMLEFHFAIFCFLAFLLYYRDWKPIVLAAAVIAVHHVSFYFLQLNQLPVFAYPSTGNFWIVLIHAAFVVAETGVLVLFARRMRNESIEAAAVAMLAETIGKGDLATRIELPNEEHSPLFDAVVEMQQSLATLIGTVARETTAIRARCGELSSLSQTVKQHSARQSRTAVQMAERAQGLVQSVAVSSDNAQHADRITTATEHMASEGQQEIQATMAEMAAMSAVIGDTVTRIEALGAATDKVAGIVSVIQGIAAQTNLLALNAAIEAARAGEQGRGFAVVADEVRQLAERTGQATTEIQGVIQGIQDSKAMAVASMGSMVDSVERGVTLAGQAGAAVNTIAGSAQEAVSVVSSIANGLASEADAAQDIGTQVGDVAAAARENDELVGRVASLALDIESTVDRIQQGIGRLRV